MVSLVPVFHQGMPDCSSNHFSRLTLDEERKKET